MVYGICTLSIVPARKEPSGTSEMVTQLLFGEFYTVIQQGDDWLKIKTGYDDYECWISAKQHTRITDATYKALQKEVPDLSGALVQTVQNQLTEPGFPVTIGSSLPFLKNNHIKFDSFDFKLEGPVKSQNKKKGVDEIINTARLFMNAPYLWGGRSPFGIDCSGYTQLVFKLNGHKLPRDAYQQVEYGEPLSFVEEATTGDLAFFDNEEGRIVHVGILLDNENIIHASGRVRIDRFDHYGIFNTDTKKYSHTLRVIKRLID